MPKRTRKNPTCYLLTLRNLLAYTMNWLKTSSYLITLPNTLRFRTKPKICSQPIRVDNENPKTLSANQRPVSQRQKKTLELSAAGTPYSGLGSTRLATAQLKTLKASTSLLISSHSDYSRKTLF